MSINFIKKSNSAEFPSNLFYYFIFYSILTSDVSSWIPSKEDYGWPFPNQLFLHNLPETGTISHWKRTNYLWLLEGDVIYVNHICKVSFWVSTFLKKILLNKKNSVLWVRLSDIIYHTIHHIRQSMHWFYRLFLWCYFLSSISYSSAYVVQCAHWIFWLNLAGCFHFLSFYFLSTSTIRWLWCLFLVLVSMVSVVCLHIQFQPKNESEKYFPVPKILDKCQINWLRQSKSLHTVCNCKL